MDSQTLHNQNSDDDRPDRRWVWFLLLLTLVLGCGCVFLASSLAVAPSPNRLTGVSLLAASRADYSAGLGEPLRFAPLNPGVGAEAAADATRLAATPIVNLDLLPPIEVVLLPATPTPTATGTPVPPTATDTASPGGPPATAVLP
ncbi:MAG: hypothetical protein ACE5G8_05935, partial [Anaerolineae bacterium]